MRLIHFQKAISAYFYRVLGAALLIFSYFPEAHAQTVSDVSGNVVNSISGLPGAVTGFSYMLGVILTVWGVLKLKEHVENPNQVTIKEPIIRFMTGGALFSLPIITEAAKNTFFPPTTTADMTTITAPVDVFTDAVSTVNVNNDFNLVLQNVAASFQDVPGIVSGVSYALGLVILVSALLKLKEHIENPQVKLRDSVARFLLSGALFSLPLLYVTLYQTFTGGTLTGGGATAFFQSIGDGVSSETGAASCAPGAAAAGTSLGDAICNVFRSTSAMPLFLTGTAYLFGLFVGVWGLFKIYEHAIEPERTSVWEGLSRLLVAGGFLALPTGVTTAYNTIANVMNPHENSGFNEGAAAGGGLDAMISGFMTDIFGPMTVLLNWFGLVAGFIFVMIGISRLMKSAQEGARGPGGLGTIMTFLMGGALLSFSPMVTALSSSLFGDPLTETNATLQYTVGLDGAEDHIYAVISAVLKFIIVLGLISILRGIFIIRSVAEGNSQASMMAATTHLVGGALAVNLGPLLTLVQNTLNITAMGVGINFG